MTTKALKAARKEVQRLQELLEKQQAKTEALEGELDDFRQTQGQRVLEAMANGADDASGVVSREIRDLKDRLDVEKATAEAIGEALIEAKRLVDREQATAWRREATKKEKQLEKLAARRDALLDQLRDVEETDNLRLEGFGQPPPLTTRLVWVIEQLRRNADRLEQGRTPVPIQDVPVVDAVPVEALLASQRPPR